MFNRFNVCMTVAAVLIVAGCVVAWQYGPALGTLPVLLSLAAIKIGETEARP